MEHGLELIIARLEILDIEVCNILQNPGNIGNLSFSTSSYPGHKFAQGLFATCPATPPPRPPATPSDINRGANMDRTIHI